MPNTCKHPQVRIVAREDDVEFVECQSCGEVFDSAEYMDIAIEETEFGEDADGVPKPSKAGKGRR